MADPRSGRDILRDRAARALLARQNAGSEPNGLGFLHIKVTLGGRDYARDLEIEARVDTDPDGLSRALSDMPGLFAWYAAAEAEARAIAKRAELDCSKLYAELYTFLEASQVRTTTDGKRAKATVEAIKSLVLMDSRYQAAQNAVIAAERQLDLMTAARQTMQVKKDVTLAVASNYRAELDSRFHDTLRKRRELHSEAVGGGRS